VPFNQYQIAAGEDVGEGVVEIGSGLSRQVDADQILADDGHGVGSCLAVLKGVFSGRIQLVDVTGVFDRAGADSAAGEFFEQFDQQRRLSVVAASDDVDTFHGFWVFAVDRCQFGQGALPIQVKEITSAARAASSPGGIWA